jgi:hypothetical protein
LTAERDRQRFELALGSPDPTTALHELAKAFKAEGMGQVAMYHLFAEFQRKIDCDDPRYDAIVDNMDLVWGGGWAKGRALYDTELTSADVVSPGATPDRGGGDLQ